MVTWNEMRRERGDRPTGPGDFAADRRSELQAQVMEYREALAASAARIAVIEAELARRASEAEAAVEIEVAGPWSRWWRRRRRG